MAGHGADQRHVEDRVAGLQHLPQRGREPVGLHPGQEVVRAAAAVSVGGAPEDRGEAVVDPDQPQLGVEEHEAHRRLAENRLRGGQVGLDLAQCGHVDGDAQGAVVGGHHIQLGLSLAMRPRPCTARGRSTPGRRGSARAVHGRGPGSPAARRRSPGPGRARRRRRCRRTPRPAHSTGRSGRGCPARRRRRECSRTGCRAGSTARPRSAPCPCRRRAESPLLACRSLARPLQLSTHGPVGAEYSACRPSRTRSCRSQHHLGSRGTGAVPGTPRSHLSLPPLRHTRHSAVESFRPPRRRGRTVPPEGPGAPSRQSQFEPHGLAQRTVPCPPPP